MWASILQTMVLQLNWKTQSHSPYSYSFLWGLLFPKPSPKLWLFDVCKSIVERKAGVNIWGYCLLVTWGFFVSFLSCWGFRGVEFVAWGIVSDWMSEMTLVWRNKLIEFFFMRAEVLDDWHFKVGKISIFLFVSDISLFLLWIVVNLVVSCITNSDRKNPEPTDHKSNTLILYGFKNI